MNLQLLLVLVSSIHMYFHITHLVVLQFVVNFEYQLGINIQSYCAQAFDLKEISYLVEEEGYDHLSPCEVAKIRLGR